MPLILCLLLFGLYLSIFIDIIEVPTRQTDPFKDTVTYVMGKIENKMRDCKFTKLQNNSGYILSITCLIIF